MKRALLLTLVLAPAFVSAHAAPFEGTWQISGEVSGHTVVSTCVLTATEGKIAGTCTGVDGKVMPATGTVTDAEVKWNYESIYNDDKIVLHYMATLGQDGNMTGSILVDPYDAGGSFTAVKK